MEIMNYRNSLLTSRSLRLYSLCLNNIKHKLSTKLLETEVRILAHKIFNLIFDFDLDDDSFSDIIKEFRILIEAHQSLLKGYSDKYQFMKNSLFAKSMQLHIVSSLDQKRSPQELKKT
jgi:hypothetical protein